MIKLWKENQYKHLFLITAFGFMFSFIYFALDVSLGYAFERFLFFTVQSNFLVVLYFLFNNTKIMEKLRLPITMLILTTFLTFNLFIAPVIVYPSFGKYSWQWYFESFLNHIINPLVMIIAYWADNRKKETKLSNYVITGYGLIYIPFLWILESKSIGFIPYIFFDFKAESWLIAISSAIGLILIFNVMSIIFRRYSLKVIDKPKPTNTPWVWFRRK